MSDKTVTTTLIDNLSAIMDAFSSVAGKNMEVVLHDLTQPDASVLKIINGHISGRQPGSSLHEGPENDLGFLGLLGQEKPSNDTQPVVFSDYRTVSLQGRPLRSATVLFKDEAGKPALSLCFNADYSAAEAAREALALLMPSTVAAHERNPTGLEDKMNDIIRTCIPPSGHLRVGSTKKEKVDIVRQMQAQGLFIVRGGVEKAAKVLGVTRYTIYNYLDQIKQDKQA